MLEIRQMLCPEDRYPLKCPHVRGTPRWIVVHNTANDAPAENEVGYMLRRPEEVSFHFAVDDREAVQGLPLDRGAFASGDGGLGEGNLYGVHIEICYSLSGGPKFDAAEQNAAQLIARLLTDYGWGCERVTKHQDYDGKYCPHRTLDRGWQRFLTMVEEERRKQDMTKEDVLRILEEYFETRGKQPASAWAEPAIAAVREAGVMVGDASGFRPRAFVTREELAQVAASLGRLGGK